MRRVLFAAALCGLAAVVYGARVRPRVLNWGATQEEMWRSMPGDDIVPDASLQTTRVVTVAAGAEHIWPWLVQMGPRPRAGAYTYDWIERLLGIDIETSDRILPEYQQIEPGKAIALNEKGQGMMVREVEPERFLVLQWVPQQSTWTFGLYAQPDGTTRLVSRNRLPGRGLVFWAGMIAFMEPGSLVMERKMLLGLKERAERLKENPGVSTDTGAVHGG
jgi:hypothetical protein